MLLGNIRHLSVAYEPADHLYLSAKKCCGICDGFADAHGEA
jgi:hypothetical protein